MYTETVRIYPNNHQCELIDKTIEDSCTLYNLLLELYTVMYHLIGLRFNKFGADKYAQIFCKKYNLHLSSIVRKGVIRRLDESYQRFFKKQNSYPVHKGLRKFRSIKSYDASKTSGCHVFYDTNKIQFVKFGKINANFTRPINGIPKTITIKKMKSGVYYAFLQIKGDPPQSKHTNVLNRRPVIAIDLGMNKFITDQFGNYVGQPRFIEFNEKIIRKEQRKLSRMVKGSNNYLKRCKRLAKLYERVHNIRKDFHFKLAHFLVTSYDKIICEDLKIRSMISSKTKSRADKKFKRLLLGCAISQFLDILTHMSKKYDCQLIKVDPANTSQLCSNCGAMVFKRPGQHHNCPHCGLVADRDINAARNIYERGMGQKYFAGTACNGTPVPLQLVNRVTVPGT